MEYVALNCVDVTQPVIQVIVLAPNKVLTEQIAKSMAKTSEEAKLGVRVAHIHTGLDETGAQFTFPRLQPHIVVSTHGALAGGKLGVRQFGDMAFQGVKLAFFDEAV